jgi:hypothetical protein
MDCPFCNNVIYHLGALDKNVFGVSTKDPSMYFKDGRQNVDCPTCHKPVRLKEVPNAVGLGFVIDPIQS